MRKQRWFWGILFVAGAGILLASEMGWLTFHLSTFTLIATIFFAIIFVKSAIYLMIPGMMFSLAFLSMLYARPLGITQMVPWGILGIALLLSIGLSLIFHPHRRWYGNAARMHAHHRRYHYHGGHDQFGDGETTTSTNDDSYVEVLVNMSSNIRYITSKDLKQVDIDVSMGGVKVYFNDAVVNDEAVINVDSNLSGTELFMPRDWDVQIDNGLMLSGVSEKGVSTKKGPKIRVTGNLRLSGLTIYYI
ncbi:hypothetical protein ABTQ33_11765 [Paucilactobacillus suebicus]|uniref:LiaF transmembrane domain-containing protein n=1 Tax=Paucilactobacillus suebicus DSM 5007 = KCTC 3549 TaxID=1423807 RepID=A0A0R1VVZ4_9LACO|nr:hypothetical protein [Paucilactobacillus suebicus]KRM09905.1 hypothetical protein FD16_GL001499 [Paucilactobacillus suebicus DSM 5007 = KCTC 3549]